MGTGMGMVHAYGHGDGHAHGHGHGHTELSRLEPPVRSGDSVLVRGAAGVGKTGLLRTICGLWPLGQAPLADVGGSELACIPPIYEGAARASGRPTYLVLPQSAPLRPGLRTTLLEQLIYPLTDPAAVPYEVACDALLTVGLAGLLEELGGLHTPLSPREWRTALSPGQRQLLVCARIFAHSPALVLLDEATSAMPSTDEARIYERLRALGIAFVSIGHRTSLEVHHERIVDVQKHPPDG